MVDQRPDIWRTIYNAAKVGTASEGEEANSKSSTDSGGNWAFSSAQISVYGNTRPNVFQTEQRRQFLFEMMMDIEDQLSNLSNYYAKKKLGTLNRLLVLILGAYQEEMCVNDEIES